MYKRTKQIPTPSEKTVYDVTRFYTDSLVAIDACFDVEKLQTTLLSKASSLLPLSALCFLTQPALRRRDRAFCNFESNVGHLFHRLPGRDEISRFSSILTYLFFARHKLVKMIRADLHIFFAFSPLTTILSPLSRAINSTNYRTI